MSGEQRVAAGNQSAVRSRTLDLFLFFVVVHPVSGHSAGMFIQCFLFGPFGNLLLFLDMALLQRVERFQFALCYIEFVAPGLGRCLALLDQLKLLADCYIEFVDELLKIAQVGRAHPISCGFLQAGLVVLAVSQQGVEILLCAPLLFVQLAEPARCRIALVLCQLDQGLQGELFGHDKGR